MTGETFGRKQSAMNHAPYFWGDEMIQAGALKITGSKKSPPEYRCQIRLGLSLSKGFALIKPLFVRPAQRSFQAWLFRLQ